MSKSKFPSFLKTKKVRRVFIPFDNAFNLISFVDPDTHQKSTAQQEPPEPPVSSSSEKINDGNHEKAIDVKNADAAKETKEVTDNRTSIKAEDPAEPGEDEEAENLYENENENEGIGHVGHAVVAESYGRSDGVEDEYYDEDAEGEYDEGEQSYESTHGDIDTLYYSENQDENTLLDENPQVEENDAQDPEPEVLGKIFLLFGITRLNMLPLTTDDNQLQGGLTPEQDASGSDEGSLYDEALGMTFFFCHQSLQIHLIYCLVPEEGAHSNAPQNDNLSSTHHVPLPRLPSSKRSFDEHEHGQYEEDGGSPSSTG